VFSLKTSGSSGQRFFIPSNLAMVNSYLPEESTPQTPGQVQGGSSDVISHRLAVVANMLLVIFVLVILGRVLPIRLLDPTWQLQISAVLADNAFVPILAMALVHLAAYLNPANEALSRRRDQFGRLAIAVVLGFLLLIPLQAVATYNLIQLGDLGAKYQATDASRRLYLLQQAIDSSKSMDEIKARFAKINAPPLPDNLLQLPLADLKKELKSQLRTLEVSVKQRVAKAAERPRQGRTQLVATVIQKILTTLACALAFSALAQPKGSEISLLQALVVNLVERDEKNAKQRQERLEAKLEKELIRAEQEELERAAVASQSPKEEPRLDRAPRPKRTDRKAGSPDEEYLRQLIGDEEDPKG
jgi:hypothetical protein